MLAKQFSTVITEKPLTAEQSQNAVDALTLIQSGVWNNDLLTLTVALKRLRKIYPLDGAEILYQRTVFNASLKNR